MLSQSFILKKPVSISGSALSSFSFHFSSLTLHSSSSSHHFSLLRAVVAASYLHLGKCVHSNIITTGLTSDRFLTNYLITAYSKCGSLSYARKLFDTTPDRDLVTWNAILSAYSRSSESDIHCVIEGFRVFRQLLECSVFTSKMTLAPVLKLCMVSGYVFASQAVHGYAVKIGLELVAFVSGSLVNIYSKHGFIKEARNLFDLMHGRDLVLWNVMLKGYVEMGLEKDALFFFSEFHRSGIRPDVASVLCVLNGISGISSDELKMCMEQIQSYATKLFPYDNNSNVVLWNKRLSEHLRAGRFWDAVAGFTDMVRSSVDYDDVTSVVVLAAATGTGDVKLGQQIHGLVLKLGFDYVVSVANSLINMYSKMGFVSLAQKVFSGMNEFDLISWNSMISSYAQNGMECVKLLKGLLHDGLQPDHFTLASILRACSSLTEGLFLSKQIHAYATKSSIITDCYVSTTLIDVYSRSGLIKEAEFLFANKNEFDLATWNAMMFGYIVCGDSLKALKLFALMHEDGKTYDEITLATAAKACGGLIRLGEGKQIHAIAVKLGLGSDLFLSSGILDMYIKCGDMVNADMLFAEIPEIDDVAWTTMISGCVENGDEDRALSVYHQMRLSGVLPDEYTFATLIKACSCLTALEQGRQIHANVIKLDCASDPFVGTSLIDMYAKCGNIEDAYCLFKRNDVKNVVLWDAILVGLAQHGHGEEALHLFEAMKKHHIQPDKVTFIAVLSACSHSGHVSKAYEYFYSMQKEYGIEPEIEHYSCLIDALGRAGRIQDAEELISSMPFEPSVSMCKALLGASRVLGDIDTGKRLAERIMELEPSDSSAYVLLSNIFASSNQWDAVINLRKAMQRKNVKKDPGFSWIDVKNQTHLFVADDRSHREIDSIYRKLEEMMKRIKEEGYVPDKDFVLLNVEEEEKERSLFYHSEKLAIAYGLLSTASSSRIRVIKNLRVCGDCHNAIKFISKVYQREIVLRDANRFHCFKYGSCSCADYW